MRKSASKITATTLTRRTFIKSSALTLGAVTILSKGTALATGGGNSNVTFVWVLRCVADPLTNTPDETIKRHYIPVGSNGNGTFMSKKDTPFDPVGPGDGSNCKLFGILTGIGPMMGAESGGMTMTTEFTATTTIRGNLRIYIGPPGGASTPLSSGFTGYDMVPKTVQILINSSTGEISYIPGDGTEESSDSVHWSAGYSEASLKNTAAFTAHGEFSHDFRTAYTGELSLSAKAEFQAIFGIEFSASLGIDINNLGKINCNPDDLNWTIRKVKKKYVNGTFVSEEISNL